MTAGCNFWLGYLLLGKLIIPSPTNNPPQPAISNPPSYYGISGTIFVMRAVWGGEGGRGAGPKVYSYYQGDLVKYVNNPKKPYNKPVIPGINLLTKSP